MDMLYMVGVRCARSEKERKREKEKAVESRHFFRSDLAEADRIISDGAGALSLAVVGASPTTAHPGPVPVAGRALLQPTPRHEQRPRVR